MKKVSYMPPPSKEFLQKLSDGHEKHKNFLLKNGFHLTCSCYDCMNHPMTAYNSEGNYKEGIKLRENFIDKSYFAHHKGEKSKQFKYFQNLLKEGSQ